MNIFLVENFEFCFFDFGLVRLMENNYMYVSVSIGGIYGYIVLGIRVNVFCVLFFWY